MICPVTDKICDDVDCKTDGCLEEVEDSGEEINKKEVDATS